MKENILVLGKGYISEKIEKYWSLYDYNLVRVSLAEFDYINDLKKIIDSLKPSFIINCYGFTGKPNVDSCEDHVEECFKRNCEDAFYIATQCAETNTPFITISTGCVYNDETGRVFTEDTPHNFGIDNPTASIYSKSKSRFEKQYELIPFGKTPNYLLRIRMPFDEVMDDKNYLKKIFKYPKRVNYKNSVTYVPDLVKFIELIIRSNIPNGIYNVVNKNPITCEEILNLYKEATGIEIKNHKWYSTDDLLSEGLMKCRRSNCVLSTDKIENVFPDLKTSQEAVESVLKNTQFLKQHQ